MLTYQSQVSISRAPETVFEYLVDPKTPGSVERRSHAATDRRAARYRLPPGSLVFGKGPLKATIGLELVAVEPGRRMVFRSFSGPISWDGEYIELTPSPDGGTEIGQKGQLTFSGLWRLLQPLVGAEISRGEVKELERLKAVVEAG